MGLDLKILFFMLAAMVIIFVLTISLRIPDDSDFNDPGAIVDVEILYVALIDLPQIEN